MQSLRCCEVKWISMKLIKWSACFFLLMACFSVSAKQLHVALLVPEFGSSQFWDSMLNPLIPAAEQLNIKLTFHHADFTDRFDYYPQAKALLEGENKPDFLIAAFRGASAKPLLELVEHARVPMITVSSGIPKNERAHIGYPQQNYKYWLAQVLADDESSGFIQTKKLLELAESKYGARGPEQKFRMVAIGGGLVLETSHQKDRGLKRAVETFKNLDLLQLVHADWNADITTRMTKQLYGRYEYIDLIWAANDDTALGAYHTAEKLVEHENMPLVAGIDWTKKGLISVTNSELAFSLGGNHMQAVWALVIVHDIAHGFSDIGFKQNTYRIPFIVADQNNIERINDYINNDRYKQSNYRQFSKLYNADITQYQFDLNKLIFK